MVRGDDISEHGWYGLTRIISNICFVSYNLMGYFEPQMNIK